MRSLFGICCLSIVLIAPGAFAAPAAPLVGNWYGVGEPDDPGTFYIDSFHADGTFNSEYRKCQDGKLLYRQTQSGTWKVTNSVLTMNSNTVNGQPERFDHSYRIEAANEREIHARLLAPGPDYLFVEKRVPAFEFPPCYVGS